MLVAVNCDFKGHDYEKVNVTSYQECLNSCKIEAKCTHFSWSFSRCFKKTGPVNETDAFYSPGFFCGIYAKSIHFLNIIF